MKERLQELAHEAGLPTYNPEGIPTKLEKFAELIVRECCQAVERKYKYSNGTPVSFWEMSQDVQDLLKKHFGVEQ